MSISRFKAKGEISSEGSFDGLIDASMTSVFKDISEAGPTEVVLYGPADLPLWKHWLYRIAGLWGHRYPERVIASGRAYVDSTITSVDEDTNRITLNFKPSGEWTTEGEERDGRDQ